MAKKDSLVQKQNNLKHTLTSGEEATLLDYVFHKTTVFLQRAIRRQDGLSDWWGVGLFVVIFFLVALGVFLIQARINPFHYSMVFWDIVFMVPTVICIKIHSDSITRRLHGQVVDFIRSSEDLGDLERWRKTFTSKRSAIVFILFFLVFTMPFVYLLAYLPTVDFPTLGLLILLLIVQVFFGMGFYNELVFLSLLSRMQNYQFDLFESDPANSTVIGNLSGMFMGTIYLSAVVSVLLTLVVVGTRTFTTLTIFLLLIPLWCVTSFFFIMIQLALAKIIARKKDETLNNIHKKMDSLQIGQNFMDEKTREAFNWWMDYYKRVKETRNSAMNPGSTLGFLNSLLLPLLTFALTNLNTFVDWFR
jgi:hypothetical protein